MENGFEEFIEGFPFGLFCFDFFCPLWSELRRFFAEWKLLDKGLKNLGPVTIWGTKNLTENSVTLVRI